MDECRVADNRSKTLFPLLFRSFSFGDLPAELELRFGNINATAFPFAEEDGSCLEEFANGIQTVLHWPATSTPSVMQEEKPAVDEYSSLKHSSLATVPPGVPMPTPMLLSRYPKLLSCEAQLRKHPVYAAAHPAQVAVEVSGVEVHADIPYKDRPSAEDVAARWPSM